LPPLLLNREATVAKLTEAQAEALLELSLRPNGAIIRDSTLKTAIYQMAMMTPPLVNGCYDMPGGGAFSRISEAGRQALTGNGRGE
jgi:hypothetical protein